MTNSLLQEPTLGIVIVNWNTGDQLRDCIRSIAQTSSIGYDLTAVVVVDNDSKDDSLHGLEEHGLPLQVLRNDSNRGFAAACNQGAMACDCQYLLFLNPDTRLFDNSLSEPMLFMQRLENSTVAICGIRLVDESGTTSTSAARFPTLSLFIRELLGLSRRWPNVFKPHFMTPAEVANGGPVDQVIGAYFLIRRPVFDLCQGFDERFFVYYEEVDLSLRVRQAGYSSYLLAQVSAFHKGGGASERVKAARLFYSLRSRLKFANKHFSPSARVALLGLTAIELPLRLIRAVVRRSREDFTNTLSAYQRLISSAMRGQ